MSRIRVPALLMVLTLSWPILPLERGPPCTRPKEECDETAKQEDDLDCGRRLRGAGVGGLRDRKPERRRQLRRRNRAGLSTGARDEDDVPRPRGVAGQAARRERGAATGGARGDPQERAAVGERPALAIRESAGWRARRAGLEGAGRLRQAPGAAP